MLDPQANIAGKRMREFLRSQVDATGWTYRQLSRRIGRTGTYLSTYFATGIKMDAETRDKLLEALEEKPIKARRGRPPKKKPDGRSASGRARWIGSTPEERLAYMSNLNKIARDKRAAMTPAELEKLHNKLSAASKKRWDKWRKDRGRDPVPSKKKWRDARKATASVAETPEHTGHPHSEAVANGQPTDDKALSSLGRHVELFVDTCRERARVQSASAPIYAVAYSILLAGYSIAQAIRERK